MSIYPTVTKILQRNGRPMNIKRIASEPVGESIVIRGASRAFRTSHPEVMLGQKMQEALEFWVDSKYFDGVNKPQVRDRLYDGDYKFGINEIDPLYEGSKVVAYRITGVGYGNNS